MKFFRLAMVLAVAGALCGASVDAVTTIVSDSYNAAGNGTGFALGSGINSGINPPTIRLSGTAAANLRYINTGAKDASAYSIANGKIRVDSATGAGRFVLSADGATPFNFAPSLGAATATPAAPVVYDVAIRMNNDSTGNQRFSIAIGTADGDVDTWSFGVQIYRQSGTDNFYTVGKRVDPSSSGTATGLNEPITTLTGNTFGNDTILLMRVTDAGSETTTFSSRVQLSLNGGNSWFYDTETDAGLPNGWRFNGAGRHIIWHIAGTAGPVTYDAFSVKRDPPAHNLNTSSVFKVMSYNIHYGAFGGKVNTQNTANYILDERVDLVVLNEVDRFRDRSNNRDLIGELAKQTGMQYVYSNNDSTVNSQMGNAILSKYPILFRNNRFLPRLGDNEQRGLLQSIVDVNGTFISFWGTHLAHNSENERLQGAAQINTWVDQEEFPVILCGDFNDTPGSVMCDRLKEKFEDIWLLAGDGTLGRTVPCPGPPGARIDYIWKAKTANITPINAFVGSLINSDHFSVLTQFKMDAFTNHSPGFYFLFDEGSGTRTIDLVGGLRGTLGTGAPAWSADSPTSQPGDSSLYFNGSKKLTIRDPGQIIGTNGLNDDYTLQAWAKLPLNYAPAQRAILFQYERQPGFSMSINTDRTLHTTTFKVKDIGSTAAVPNDGQWHHVAVVHTDGANMKFYIDAVLAATVNYKGGAGYRTSPTIVLGSDSDGANPFTGWLDRVKFDDRALVPSAFDYPAIATSGTRWTGAAGNNWDYTTTNWFDEAQGGACFFANGLITRFQDDALTGNIYLAVSPNPMMVIVDNSAALAYRFSGSGTISAPLLRKSGAGSLTLATTAVNPIVNLDLNQGTVIVDHPSNLSFSSALMDSQAGLGVFVKTNTRTLTLTGDNSTFDGTIGVAQGILKAGTANALGTTGGPTVIANGATLDVNDFDLRVEPVIVSGAGVGGAGAIIDSTSSTAVQRALQNVTLAGDTTIGGPGRWDFKAASASDPGLIGNGYKLTKVSANWIGIAGDNGAVWNTDLGDVEIRQGVLSFETGANMGRAGSNLVVYPGAMLTLFNTGAGNLQVKRLFMTNATMRLSGPTTGGGSGEFGGPITLSGSNRFEVLNGAVHTFLNEIRGASAFVKTSTDDSGGTLILSASNSYTGLTVIESNASGSPGYNGRLRIKSAHGLGATGVGTIVGAGACLELEGPFEAPLREALQLAGAGGSGSPGALRNISGNNTVTGPIMVSNPGFGTYIANSAGLTVLTLDVPSGNAIMAVGAANALTFAGAGSIAVHDPIVLGSGSLQANLNKTLWLNSTVDAPVTVTKGNLSGTGTINNHVFVSAGQLSPGDPVGTMTINGSLWMTNTALFEIDKSSAATNDMVVVGGVFNAGGTLNVSNLGPALASGDVFKLFSKPATGALVIPSLPPLDAGLWWTNMLAVDGTLRVLGSEVFPMISGVTVSGGNLVMTGAGGSAGAGYRILSSTNVSLPLSQWASLLTNQFNSTGQFSNAIPTGAGEFRHFFRLVTP